MNFHKMHQRSKTKQSFNFRKNKKYSSRQQNYDPWDYFAELLCNDYKFNAVTVVREEYIKQEYVEYGKKWSPQLGNEDYIEYTISTIDYETISKLKKVIVIKTPYDDFSIRIENASSNMIKMYYCYHNEGITLNHYLMFCSKIITETNNHNEIITNILYASNDIIDDNTIYINDAEKLDHIFGPHDLIDGFVASKIIKHLHFYLHENPKFFFRFVMMCGYNMTQRIYCDEQIDELFDEDTKKQIYSDDLLIELHKKLQKNDNDYEYYLRTYNDILRSYEQFMDKNIGNIATYEYNEILYHCCSSYVQCRDMLYRMIFRDSISIESIQQLIIYYLVGS